MTATSTTWTEETIDAPGAQLHLIQGGSGVPLIVMHDELGHPGWLRFHDALSRHFTLYLPLHPGFGVTERLDWIMNMRDLAGWYLEVLDDMDLGPAHLLGHGLGGWIAAEMASMCPHHFKRLVLASTPGLKPPSGEIFDMFMIVAKEYLAKSFLNPGDIAEYQALYGNDPTPEQLDQWEYAREEASRLTWRPYMHYPSLAPLLHRLKQLPTLIIWGKNDTIIPVSAGEAYQAAIPGSQLVLLDNCGHHPEIEQADIFVQHVQRFLQDA